LFLPHDNLQTGKEIMVLFTMIVTIHAESQNKRVIGSHGGMHFSFKGI